MNLEELVLPDAVIARFWAKVALPDGNGCMLWTAGATSAGYGQFKVGRAMVGAHRLSLFLATGTPAPEQTEAAHECRTPRCVAPRHLRWTSHFENIQDRERHGTTARGETAAAAKLTRHQVDTIRERYSRGDVSQRALAAEYGIHQAQVFRIVHLKSWRLTEVPDDPRH